MKNRKAFGPQKKGDSMTNTNSKAKSKFNAKDIAFIALFTCLMAVCSWISIPTTVPFTLQTFAVFMAVLCLGGKKGTISILVYILLGAVGVPVFANFTGGVGILLGSTGGYIIGFLLTGILFWVCRGIAYKNIVMNIIFCAAGLIICYAFGTVWFMVVYGNTTGSIGLWTALMWCVIPYIAWDALKIGLAVVISRKLRPVLQKFMS